MYKVKTNLTLLLITTVLFCNAQIKGETKNDSTVTKKYYFEMTKEQETVFIKNAKQISIGDSVKKVISILGKPDCDQIICKKKRGRNKKDIFIARELTYYLKIWEKGLANEKYDEFVYFYFDKNNILYKVNSNVDSIPSR